MPVDQWGNVIFADELTKSGIQQNQDERERKRQGALAQYLQQQGMAPGENVPPEVGPEFSKFMQSGGLKGYQEEKIAQEQGTALSGIADAISKHEGSSPDTQMMGKAYSQAFKSGGIRGPAAIEMMKELQMQHARDINAKAMAGITPGIVPESLDSDRGILEMKVTVDPKTGLAKPTIEPLNRPGAQFNAHGDRATRLLMKKQAGMDWTPQERFQYLRSANLVNNWRPEMRTPDMMQFTRFPEVNQIPTANTSKVKPGEAPQPGQQLLQGGHPDVEVGQTVSKYLPDSERVPFNHLDYKGPYQVFSPPPQIPIPGQIGERIPKSAPVQEVDKIRDQEFAVNSLRHISDSIEKMNMGDRERLGMALKIALSGVPVVGGLTQSFASMALPPDAAAIMTHIGHAQLRYETSMAGVRGASSTGLYPVFQKILGNLGDVNAPTKLRSLANDMQTAALIGQRDMVSNRYQGVPLHFRPENASGKPARQATAPSTSPIAPQTTPPNSAGVTGTPMNRPPLSSFQR